MRRERIRVAAVVFVLLSLAAGLAWLPWRGGPPIDSDAPAVTSGDQVAEMQVARAAAAAAEGAERVDVKAPAAAEVDADVALGSLRVVVRYADGSMASDIGVTVRESLREVPNPTFRRLRTDDAGEVRVADLRPGVFIVWTDTQAMQREQVNVVAGPETELVVELKAGIDLNGVVVDDAGAPVGDALILVAGWAGSEARAICRSDAQGRFSLRQFSRMTNVTARAVGFAPSPFRSVSAGAGAVVDVRIVLSGAGGSVHGQVVDPGGNPVVEAIVAIGEMPPFGRVITLPDGAKGMHPPRPEERTDTNGAFVLDGLTPGTTQVTVRTDRFAPWEGTVEVVARTTTALTVRLEPGVVCEGVARGEEGENLAGVEIQHGAYRSAEYRRSFSTADGSYRLAPLPAGDLELRASSDEHGKAVTTLHARAGETVRWDVTLSRGLVLRGVVRGRENAVLERVMVEAMGPFVKGRSTWSQFATTDAEGRFALIDCPSGPILHLRLRRGGYETLDRMDVDAAAGPLDLQMRYEGEPTARIVGKVIDPAGQPVATAQIVVGRRGDGSGGVRTTEADGSINVDKLRPGTYWLRIESGTYAEHVTVERTLAPDEIWDLGMVQMLEGGRLRVELAPLGEGRKRPYLSVYSVDGRFHASVRGDELRSDSIEPGRYELRVSGAEVVPARQPVEIRAGVETVVEVQTEYGVPCALEFALPDGTDRVHGLDFELHGPGRYVFVRRLSRWRPTPFRHSLGLAPGAYRLSARTTEGHTGTLAFEVEASSGGSPRVLGVTLR